MLETLEAMHARKVGHHHLSPYHVFWQNKGSTKVILSAPCPLAAPAQLREVLMEPLPDEYFPPDLWVRVYDSSACALAVGVALISCQTHVLQVFELAAPPCL
jgi:hypothetical protein